jgi:DNA polymerase
LEEAVMSAKREILNYLQFLQESGFLYVEGIDAEKLLGPRTAGEGRAVSSGQARRSAASAMSPGISQASPGAAGEQADLFGTPERLPSRRPTAPPLASLSESPEALTPLGGEDLPREGRVARLAELAQQAEACRACVLGSRRNRLVFSDGDPEAKIVFVGEAPGGDEDAQGVPFVGRAGQLLTKMIAAIGFARREVYICNMLKCRPPENRDPLPDEKAACEHFLAAQLEIVRPRILVALGAHAAQYLCRLDQSIGRLRGRWHAYHGIPLLATYHPAFLLRSPSFKQQSWDDFQKIHAKYCGLCPDDPRKLWQKEG